MTTCSNCCEDPCYPSPIDVTITQTVVNIAGNEISFIPSENLVFSEYGEDSGIWVATLANTPYASGTVQLYLNGVHQRQGTDFSVGTNSSGTPCIYLEYVPEETPAVYTTTYWASGLSTQNIEVGTIRSWAGAVASIPSGWLLCDGKSLGPAGSGADYAGVAYRNLYNVVQRQYMDPTTGFTSTSWTDGETVDLPDRDALFMSGSDIVAMNAIIKY